VTDFLEKWRNVTLTRAEFEALAGADQAAFLEAGGGGRIIENGGAPRTIRREAFDCLSPEQKLAHAKAGGKVID
jgi:hypothetical protein